MESKEIIEAVLEKVPHQPPFRFVDEISFLEETGIKGNYYLSPDADFYRGHFPGYPITPGVILTEIMAQTGMVAFGIYLMMLNGEKTFKNMACMLTETNIKFKKQVTPGQRVYVHSEKLLFRHGKLQCNISLYNSANELLCHGNMSGMLITKT